MARYCGNCGAQLDDDARICGQCGTPLENPSAASHSVYVNPEKRKKTGKKIKLILGAVIAFIVLVTVINVVSKFTGYNGLLRKFMKAYGDYDVESLVALSSSVYGDDFADYADDFFEYNIGTALDAFEASVGHNYKLTYEVNETYRLSDRKMDDLAERIEGMYGSFNMSVISNAVVADLTLTATQGTKSAKKNMEITMIKENGKWKLLFLSL